MVELSIDQLLFACKNLQTKDTEIIKSCTVIIRRWDSSPLYFPFCIDLIHDYPNDVTILFYTLGAANKILTNFNSFIEPVHIDSIMEMIPALLENTNSSVLIRTYELIANIAIINIDYLEIIRTFDQTQQLRILDEMLKAKISFDKNLVFDAAVALLTSADSSDPNWLKLLISLFSAQEDNRAGLESLVQCINTENVDENYQTSMFSFIDVALSFEEPEEDEIETFNAIYNKIHEYAYQLAQTDIEKAALMYTEIIDSSPDYFLDSGNGEVVGSIFETIFLLLENEETQIQTVTSLSCSLAQHLSQIYDVISDYPGLEDIYNPILEKCVQIIYQICDTEQTETNGFKLSEAIQALTGSCSENVENILQELVSDVGQATLFFISNCSDDIISHFSRDIIDAIITAANNGSVIPYTLNFICAAIPHINSWEIFEELGKLSMEIAMVEPTKNNIDMINYLVYIIPTVYMKICQDTNNQFVLALFEVQSAEVIPKIMFTVLVLSYCQGDEVIKQEFCERLLELALTKGYDLIEKNKPTKFFEYIINIIQCAFEQFSRELTKHEKPLIKKSGIEQADLKEFMKQTMSLFVENILTFLEQNELLFPEEPEHADQLAYFFGRSLCTYEEPRFHPQLMAIPQDLITLEHAFEWFSQAAFQCPAPKVFIIASNLLCQFMSSDQIQVFIDAGMATDNDNVRQAVVDMVTTNVRTFLTNPSRTPADLIEWIEAHELFACFLAEDMPHTIASAVNLYTALVSLPSQPFIRDRPEVVEELAGWVEANIGGLAASLVQSLFVHYDASAMKILIFFVQHKIFPVEGVLDLILSSVSVDDAIRDIFIALVNAEVEEQNGEQSYAALNEFMANQIIPAKL